MSVVLWISNDQESWFLEFFGQLIGKGTWNPSWWWTGSASGILTELVDGSLTVLFGTDDDDFSEVWNWSDHSGGKFDFVVSLINSEDIIAGVVLFFDELFHVVINLVSSEMNLKFIINCTLAANNLRMSVLYCSVLMVIRLMIFIIIFNYLFFLHNSFTFNLFQKTLPKIEFQYLNFKKKSSSHWGSLAIKTKNPIRPKTANLNIG